MDSKAFSFAGHESFPFRYAWLTKGITTCDSNPTIFNSNDAMAILGVGKNMVRSMRHWCLATGMLEEDPSQKKNRGRWLRPSELAQNIFIGKDAWDPYLEDIGTLWLLHWLLTTHEKKATAWYYAFNQIHQLEFSKHHFLNSLVALTNHLPNARVSRNTLKRDIDIFVRTYVLSRRPHGTILEESLDCPLGELNLIRPSQEAGHYIFNRGYQESIPMPIFLFTLVSFGEMHLENKRTFTFEELAYADKSPGKVLKIDEASLGERLEKVVDLSHGAIQFTETAGLKQIFFKKDLDKMRILKQYYAKSKCKKVVKNKK